MGDPYYSQIPMFVNSLTPSIVFVTRKLLLMLLMRSFMDMHRGVKNLSCSMFPAEIEQGNALPSCFSS